MEDNRVKFAGFLSAAFTIVALFIASAIAGLVRYDLGDGGFALALSIPVVWGPLWFLVWLILFVEDGMTTAPAAIEIETIPYEPGPEDPPRLPVWNLEHEGRVIPVFGKTVAPGIVETRPRQARRHLDLPDGIDLFQFTEWVTAVWDSRNLDSAAQIRFSEVGARRCNFTKDWTRDQVRAAKKWLVDLGWIEITNPEKGNYRFTEAGERAFPRIADWDEPEDIRAVAAEFYTPPPRRIYADENDDLSRSRTLPRARTHARNYD